MKTVFSTITREIVSGILEKAGKDYPGRGVCVAVCDVTGLLLSFHRADGAPFRSIAIAQNKAYTAVRMCSSTAAFGERLKKDGVPASAFGDDRLTPLAGGQPVVIDSEKVIIAGIGISGLKPEEDDALATWGAEAYKNFIK